MSATEQRIGKAGEELAATVLRSIGVKQLERVGTPVTVLRSPSTGKITGAFYGEPVAADFRGVMPKSYEDGMGWDVTVGQSVMAEVKTIEHNLRWSDFREHQPDKLTEHAALGGLSLVVWVHSSGVYVLQWPINGFGSGKSIGPELAEQIKFN